MTLKIISEDDIGTISYWLEDKSRNYVTNLYTALAHGSQEHRLWLQEAIKNWFEGKPLPGVKS